MTFAAVLAVAGGGALGAVARYGLTLLLPRASLPAGTLLSNLLGCLVMGAALQWLASNDWHGNLPLAREPLRLWLAVGFCGSFTTLSAFVFEASALLQRDAVALAGGYLLATLAGGFACFYAGVLLARLAFNTN